MPRSPTCLLALSLTACAPAQLPTVQEVLPDVDLSTDWLDFGEVNWGAPITRSLLLTNQGDVDMGVSSIQLIEDGFEANFVVQPNWGSVICPDSDDTAASAAAKGASVDTYLGGDTGNPNPGGDDTGEEAPASANKVLGPGCKLNIEITLDPTTVGKFFAGLAIDTANDGADDPTYFRDPDAFHQVVILEGSGMRDTGNIVVTPRTLDLGHLSAGESSYRYLYVHNVGDGDLTLTEPTLDESCGPGFTVDTTSYDMGSPLEAQSGTMLQVNFTPDDTDAVYCAVYIGSDDDDSPEVEVNLKGNSGDDPQNVPPTVTIHYPPVGTVHNQPGDLVMEITAFDENQPATSLYCKVSSAVQLDNAKIADCTPTDESGHVYVTIPSDELEVGTDTLVVTVTDQAEVKSYASTTLLYMAGYPSSDDDGDGYGENDPDNPDCDDNDPTSYPHGTEVYDGADNDCDEGIDEGTDGFDDDGDSLSEIEGDCDDNEPATYPGAPEQPDQKDNDCDGTVDEGTSLYDDDGDGFTETDNDCDDDNAEVHPAALEICDGIDNNCNGLQDYQEGCEELDSQPHIIGGIRMTHNAIGAGESTTMTAQVHDADGQAISFAWQEDSEVTSAGHIAIDNPTAQTITWTAPDDLPNNADAKRYSVIVQVMDEDGNQAWAFGEIDVYGDPVGLTRTRVVIEPKKACFGSSSAAVFLLPMLGLFAGCRRRESSLD
jgi:hypothetical protein